MAGSNFTDAFRSTFMGQRDQVNAENKAAREERKYGPGVTTVNIDPGAFVTGFINALRATNPLGGITKLIPIQTIGRGVVDLGANVGGQIYDSLASGNTEQVATEEQKTEETTQPVQPEDESETIVYTYKPGDTFGQVITDLGLKTGNGLWGTNGDVEYYTQQLIDQGALDERGNIPIGTTIKLRRRK